MAIQLLAPRDVSEVSHGRESYKVIDGRVTVPDIAAAELIASHGFVDPSAPHPAAAPKLGKRGERIQPANAPHVTAPPPASDDDPIIDDEQTPSAAQFSAALTQNEMKQYLRHHGVPIPRTGTVRDLRVLVEKTWTENEGREPVVGNDAGEHAEATAPGFTPPSDDPRRLQPNKTPAVGTKQGGGKGTFSAEPPPGT